ncbi:hypothetical protein [Phytopseudomonas daroniae]|uniref:hypothetical protein n=1 Tax=Phytopseudomonas daroniae TaxID=2487519 RepID=UPI00103855EC|nr:hypothetical protein [Pseudomonas daroniae]TBU78180.1 hypothetical protein DNK10_00065 [Pseudomonas daroniae]
MTLTTLFACLLTAGLTASLTLWLTHGDTPPVPNVLIPERLVDRLDDQLVVMGGWVTEDGYQPPGRSAVEIRCYREQQLCTEAVASIFHHTDGSDLEAQTYLYQVTSWTDLRIDAVAPGSMAGCLDRHLRLYPLDKDASLRWAPGEGCEGDTGLATLVGDEWLD